MSELDAGTQRFLRAANIWLVAEALAGQPATNKGGACYHEVDYQYHPRRGLEWTWRDEHPDTLSGKYVHRVSWAKVIDHGRAQPAHLRARLTAVLDTNRTEGHRFSQALDAINGDNRYFGASDEQRETLDAEWRRHMPVFSRIVAELQAVLTEMLPLGDGEPADLFEWIERLT